MVTASGSPSTVRASCKTVHIYFGATKDSKREDHLRWQEVASGTRDAQGTFSVPFKVPDKAPKGTTLIMAERYASGRSLTQETTEFTVT